MTTKALESRLRGRSPSVSPPPSVSRRRPVSPGSKAVGDTRDGAFMETWSKLDNIRGRLIEISQPSDMCQYEKTAALAYVTYQTCHALDVAARYKVAQQRMYVGLLEEESKDAELRLREAESILDEISPSAPRNPPHVLRASPFLS
ncbi:hypothetical protein BV22DRAFT_1135557 [Leucogyrophana mollusca]|uniref:Uncharacterized protein n=1 Tax=Leucogyrophana mollusca TaxID=85980 RepID=A0ACB8AW33_9AGAM|nr:hypothetical protein BV22DRAFT_1135557 [Leucogyrophana mollusca]